MENVRELLGALYTGDKEKASKNIDTILKDKANQGLDIKKVAVASDIFNKKD
jgi:hypothetical protein